jgi:hypothetical protein
MQAQQSQGRAIGLDVGTSRIVAAEPNGEGFHYRAQLNTFLALPFSKVTESMLRKEEVPYKIVGTEILVLGERAQNLAHTLSQETRRPMQNGLLNPGERKNLEVIEEIVVRICGRGKAGDKVCLSVPSPAPGNEGDLAYHRTTLMQLLESLGYQVQCLNEGLAVVFSELSDHNFTGIGISFGGGTSNVCLAYLGLPVVNFSTAKAGDFIDRSTAGVTAETSTAIRLMKEQSLVLNGRGGNDIDRALSVYYDEVIDAVVSGLEDSLRRARKVPQIDKPVPVAVAGGSARPKGFMARLEAALSNADLPLKIAEIRLAANPLDTTAKGALMAAMLEM